MATRQRRYLTEFKSIICLAWPLMLTHFLRFINPSLSIMICGHLSREELDAASLANTIINVLGLSIDMGFSTASETLFCQTYGSTRRKLMGIILQRAILIMTLIFLILACIHVNIESFLLPLGQDPLISSLTTEYILYFLPGLFFDYMFLTLARYMESQNHVKPMVVAAICGTVFTIFAQFVFVLKLNLGMRASAGFLSISFGIMLLAEIMYIVHYRLYIETWDGLDFRGAMSDWSIFFKLGIPGILMIALEEWCLELSTFVAGAMGDEILGAQAITFQVQSILYMIPLGISTAVNVRVGQGLGAFDPEAARHTYYTALFAIIGIVLLTVVPVIFLRHSIPFMFTSDSEVAAISTSLIPMLIIFQFCEGLAGVSEAVLLACGRQNLGAIVIFMGYYMFGLPLGFYLTYKLNFGIIGMWIGLAIGFVITAVTYTYFAVKTDWTQQSRIALNNVQQRSENSSHGRISVKKSNGGSNGFLQKKPPVDLLDNCLLVVEEDKAEINNLVFPVRFRSKDKTIGLQIALFVLIIAFLLISLFCRFAYKEPYWRLVCTKMRLNVSNTLPRFCDIDNYITMRRTVEIFP